MKVNNVISVVRSTVYFVAIHLFDIGGYFSKAIVQAFAKRCP